MKKKRNWKSSKYIGILSLGIFVAVSAGVLFSSYYMNLAVREEENAEGRRSVYRRLGENLADASDYLTAEVRYFAVTQDMEHFYNYWYEIYVTRKRDNAITVFENSNPPQNEQELLESAKHYSDLLVETETLSMKLTLLSMGKTPKDYIDNEKLYQYVAYVYRYPLPQSYEQLESGQMQQAAIALLFDNNYETNKDKIMTPIDQFQTLMNERLDREVRIKRQKTRLGTSIQVMIALITLGTIAFLIRIMNQLYIKPLKKYTREISGTDLTKEDSTGADNRNIQILDAKIVPDGAGELVQFSIAYNHMIDMFFGELCHRKNAEENMKKARNEAELANESKGIFLAQMSHELRTPLNAVNGYTYLLDRTNLDEKQSEYVENIRKSAKGLLELINHILDFSKMDMGKLVLEEIPFSLKELAEEVGKILSVQAMEKQLYLNLSVDPDIPKLLIGDPLRTRQVLMNLIGNAVKFTEQGGVEVTISLGEMLKLDKCIIEFRIRDTGIGIPPEFQEKIFQPFIQSDASITRKYGGTGLGLPISSEIVALSGDKTHRLHVESEVGCGSTFFFEMDYKVAQENISHTVNEGKLIDCRGRKILLTDDNEINIQVQREILNLTGAEVITAKSGKQALGILEEEKDIDLILMDIRMPQLDGYETTKKLRKIERYQKTPVIALTADAMTEVQENIVEAGMNGCILKPIQQEELFSTIHRILGVDYREDSIYMGNLEEKTRKDTSLTIELFQEERCLRHLAGNENSFLQIIHTFLELHRQDDRKLITLLKQKNWKEAEELLHLLKGVTGNLCCYPLAEECERLRREIRENRGKDLGEQDSFFSIWKFTLSQVDDTYEKRIKVLDEQCENNKDYSFTLEQLKICIDKLLSLSDDYDTEVIDIFEKNQKQLQGFLGKEVWSSLKKYAMHYDFENLGKELKRIKKQYQWEVDENVSSDVSGG